MASKYPRTNSPFWWIKYRTPEGDYRCVSSGLRRDNVKETRSADRLVERYEREESKTAGNGDRQHSAFTEWVPGYLDSNYNRPETAKTYEAYGWRWHSVTKFLETHQIKYPRQIAYDHAWKYLEWRKSGKDGIKAASHNTALQEIKFLSMLMTQAVRRGFADGNPLIRPGIQKHKPAEKPAMTDEEITRIRQELGRWPEWMRTCFEIAIYTGCRLSDTNIPLKDVDVEAKTITLEKPKGGTERAFTVPMREELVPLFTRLKQERTNEQTAYDFVGTGSKWEKPSKMWWRFFKQNEQLNLPHLTFHCTRVTFVTRGAKQGVPQSKMMKLVNHASEEIHRVYQRLVVADVREELNAIKFPAAAAPVPRPLDDTHIHPASEKRGERKSTPKPPKGPDAVAA
ncbi:MAG: tyrosine-type recombinase/integrase [Verrucomicrobiota bacterium]|jgi:site-specific recombinase XerD